MTQRSTTTLGRTAVIVVHERLGHEALYIDGRFAFCAEADTLYRVTASGVVDRVGSGTPVTLRYVAAVDCGENDVFWPRELDEIELGAKKSKKVTRIRVYWCENPAGWSYEVWSGDDFMDSSDTELEADANLDDVDEWIHGRLECEGLTAESGCFFVSNRGKLLEWIANEED